MSRATDPKTLPLEFVHWTRNELSVAIGLADLLALTSLPPRQAADVANVRDACLRAAKTLQRWAASGRRVASLVLSVVAVA